MKKSKGWKRLYEPKEEIKLTDKQEAEFIICNIMVFNNNSDREGNFQLAKKYIKEKGLEGVLTDEEIYKLIDEILANYAAAGI